MSVFRLLAIALTLLSSPLFADDSYKARIGIEHEAIFHFDRKLSIQEIVDTLAQEDEIFHLKIDNNVHLKIERGEFPSDILSKKFHILAETLVSTYDSYSDYINLHQSRGHYVGERVFFCGATRVVQAVGFRNGNETLTLEEGVVVPANEVSLQTQSPIYDHTEFDYALEFIAPSNYRSEISYTDKTNYFSSLREINQAKRNYINTSYKVMQNAYLQIKKYKFNNTNFDELKYAEIARLNAARLHILKSRLGLKVVSASFASVPDLIVLNRYALYKNTIYSVNPETIQGRSYHLSITLPQLAHADSFEKALYSANILQWLEPALIATYGSGDPRNIKYGVSGSFRIKNNYYVAAGTVPLNVCRGDTSGHMDTCIDLAHNETQKDRFGIGNKACYPELIENALDYHLYKRAIDFKGKEYGSNIVKYDNGFELRIFDNLPPREFTHEIAIFALALAHAEATFAHPMKRFDYVNLRSPDARQSLVECAPCVEKGLHCNSWQLTMASVLRRGYRAFFSNQFIADLEKNLNLKFWTPGKNHRYGAYSFEVMEAISAELYKRYHDHRLVKILLGSELKAVPQVFKKSLDEWAFYFTDKDAEWNQNWLDLKESLPKEPTKISRYEMELNYISKHFASFTHNSYEDILFTLQKEGIVDLEFSSGYIEKVCIHCKF